MKFNLKVIALAATMLAAASAHANITSGSTGNGSLSLLAYNTDTKAWYLRDLGIKLNGLVPTGVTTGSGDGGIVGDKSPAAGLVLDKGVTGYSNFGGDTNWTSWLAAQDSSKVLWSVQASDSLSTSANNLSRMIIMGDIGATLSVSNGQVTNGVAAINGLSGLTFSGISGSGSSLGSTFTNDWGLTPKGITTSALDTNSFLYYINRTVATSGSTNPANIVRFQNDPLNQALVRLSSNGDFSYTLAPVSAVPLPGTVWLMGAGLMGVMGAVRRRKALRDAA